MEPNPRSEQHGRDEHGRDEHSREHHGGEPLTDPSGAAGTTPAGDVLLSPTGLEVATFADRAMAWLVDLGLSIALYLPVVIVSNIVGVVSSALGALTTLVGFFAVWGVVVYVLGWLPGLTGQTPGKRIIGLRVVHGPDGQLLGGPKHLVRTMIGGFANGVFCYAGWLWPLWDKQRETFADKIVTSQVVKHPKGSLLPIFPEGKPF